jgi:hypothetical protein
VLELLSWLELQPVTPLTIPRTAASTNIRTGFRFRIDALSSHR